MYKLSFYVPETHLEAVKAAVFATGAGRYKAYDNCCWQVPGVGQFRPLDNSQPFIGTLGQLEQVDEYKVEMICKANVITGAVQALLKAHPYEEPAYDIVKILMAEDF